MQKHHQLLTNIHANCLVIANRGILICGPSGSGKTTLMIQLLQQASSNSLFAAMVADDQAFVYQSNGRLIGMGPSTTKGLVEVHGFGIDSQHHLASAMINLVVKIIPPEKLDRYPEKITETIMNVCLPSVSVPRYNWQQAIHIIMAKLGI